VKRPICKSTIIKEFSRFAYSYDMYNIIQREVASELVSKLQVEKYDKIIDIGCGSGAIYNEMVKNNIAIDKFIALDSSENMLVIHPSDIKIKKYCINFDDSDAFNDLDITNKSLLLSSSALQWSQDLDILFRKLSNLSEHIHFSIFTSNTFKTLHKIANIDSPIHSSDILKKTINKHYAAKFEIKTYKLYFNSVREMFKYIKKSGVSGGEKQLGYKQIKELMSRYTLDYLEFEVLFVTTLPLVNNK